MAGNPHLPKADDAYWVQRLHKIQRWAQNPARSYRELPEIRRVLTRCVNQDPTAYSAATTISKVLPMVKGDHDYAEWRGLAQDALQVCLQHKTRTRAEMWISLGEYLLECGDLDGATAAAEFAVSSADGGVHFEIELRAHLLHIRTYGIRGTEPVSRTEEHIARALLLAERLEADHPLHAVLVQAQARFYMHQQNTRLSDDYARRAYGMWRRLDNPRGRAECAIIMAHNARIRGDFRRVNVILSKWHAVIGRSAHFSDYGNLLYARGVLLLENDQPLRAITDLTAAYSAFMQMNMRGMAMACQYARALAYGEIGEFQRAALELRAVDRYYRSTGRMRGHIDIRIALSSLQRKQGSLKRAAMLLNKASGMLKHIEDSSLRGALEEAIAWQASLIWSGWQQQLAG